MRNRTHKTNTRNELRTVAAEQLCDPKCELHMEYYKLMLSLCTIYKGRVLNIVSSTRFRFVCVYVVFSLGAIQCDAL